MLVFCTDPLYFNNYTWILFIRYLICERQRNKKKEQYCPGKAVIDLNHEGYLNLQVEHNHEHTELDMDMPYIRQALRRRATILGAMSVPMKHVKNEKIPR